ncbi:hypothetical protein J3R80_04800 [Aliiroseovarius sp. Z3]|uniref:hypothetical protein n=1 Tax=Aliiroseovarius sp. Z3 TaxID=2811402 RepID=UPI0023B22F99|nr:hypothetical protein [Aliiroseovarius sp. Z3]MDE9449787.1 hypothetical protein [Aliiroseovarius sp. Z3]
MPSARTFVNRVARLKHARRPASPALRWPAAASTAIEEQVQEAMGSGVLDRDCPLAQNDGRTGNYADETRMAGCAYRAAQAAPTAAAQPQTALGQRGEGRHRCGASTASGP